MLVTENKDFETLLKNLQYGLKTHSVKELNDALTIALNTKYDQKTDIEYVLTLVCKTYEIGIKALLSRHGRGKIQDAKQMAYCLLHFNLGLSVRNIAKKVFSNWPTSVLIGIKRYKTANPKIKSDLEFIDKYKLLQENYLQYISNKNKQESE